MKKFITYSYSILLLLTCTIAFPFVLNEITNNGEVKASKIEETSELPESTCSQETEESNDVTGSTPEISEQGVDSNESAYNNTDQSSKTSETITNTSDSSTTNTNNNSYNFTTVSTDYFDDALFIGDSRTIGLYEYGSLKNATFFAHNGLNVYKVFDETVSVSNVGKVTLSSLLEQKNFNKIYIMLGINELGYNFNNTIEKYEDMIKSIQKVQPNAIYYLQGNLHVTKSRSNSDNVFNNDNINKFNSAVETMADNQTKFYIDVNEIFDDSNGNLNSEYTSDDTHVLGKYYNDWCDWLTTKAIDK